MMPEDSQTAAEKAILKRQYMALAAMFILFFVSAMIAVVIFGNEMIKIMRTVILFAALPHLYIGISSIRNKVSILRPRGRRQHATGRQAVMFGVVAIIAAALNLLIVFSPILPFLFETVTGGSLPN